MLDIDTSDWRPIPHAEAAALLRGKPPVTRDLFDRLLPEYRARAFLVTGIDSADALAEIRDLLATVPEGQDWDRTRRDLIERLDPWLGDQSARRAELLMRHHIYQAYAVTNTLHLDAQADLFPYRQYLTAQDERVRPSHAALNNIILPWDSPFWDTHTPPWGWGCRCDVVGLSEDDALEIRDEDAQRPPEKALFLDGPLRDRLEQAGELVRGPNEIYKVREEWQRGPGWNPRDLRLPIETLAQRYADQPEVWQEFRRWASATALPGLRMVSDRTPATVWRWTSGQAIEAGEAEVTTAPVELTLDEMLAKAQMSPVMVAEQISDWASPGSAAANKAIALAERSPTPLNQRNAKVASRAWMDANPEAARRILQRRIDIIEARLARGK